jgi:glycosyltransferase involved in cell wall biosynthesis
MKVIARSRISAGRRTDMSQPYVSVIIPTYNRAATIERAVRSVLAQTFADFELLVVDDGSTDDTGALVEGLGDPRVRLMRLPVNSGPAVARNAGINAARGTLIAFLDSDDIWLPHKLERQVAAMNRAGPSALASCTGFAIRRAMSRGSGGASIRFPTRASGRFESILNGCMLSPGTTLIVHRDAFGKIGLLDSNLRRLEDWDWLLRYLEHYELEPVAEVLAEVSVGAHPSPEAVRDATQRLLATHASRIEKRCGAAGLRRFRASLFLEELVACGRHRQPLAAGLAATKAMMTSPYRFAAFGLRALRKLNEFNQRENGTSSRAPVL